MKTSRYKVVAEQLHYIRDPFDADKVSEALSRIAFAALPDWGEFEVPAWLIEGLRPLFLRLFELSDPLKTDLLECLAHLYDSPAEVAPDLDLGELKDRLDCLPVTALPYALLIIASEGQASQRYLKPYADHGNPDVRAEACSALERLGRSQDLLPQ